MLLIFISVFLFLAAVYFLFHNSKPKNFPPGPTPLPFLGNLLNLGNELHTSFHQLSQKYGPVVGVMFGPERAICVHGTKLIKEAYNEPNFTGRAPREAGKYVSGDETGIVNNVGEAWAEQRRFALRHLRDFGFGKSSMEELIMDEVKEVSDWLKQQNGKPVELLNRFYLAVVNSLWKIVTGERFEHDDQKLHQILHDLEAAQRALFQFESIKTVFIFFYPKIAKLFPGLSGWKGLVESAQPRIDMFKRIIQEHLQTLPDNSPRDFIDVYLQEVQKTTNPNSSFYKENGIKALASVMADFFIAGTDTTAVTLSWLNLYLLHTPRVQAKLHEELDRVVGRSRTPNLSDRKNLPYTEAVILETLRVSSIATISVPHAATEDPHFHGFDIPKGTVIFANIYGNHHDPKIWGNDVEEFRPERFLSADGKTVQRNEALIPFSTGKRVCLGETLARDTLFLFAANLAQSFEVTIAPNQKMPSLVPKTGQLTLTPQNTYIVMKERIMH